MNSARSWVVWSVAALAYIAAILHRSSLGVAVPDAAERFDVQAGLLSTLGAVQLAVYAVMQIPVGVLLDRYGPRILIAAGAGTMAAGQLVVALAEDLPVAVVGRVLVGLGDAATFISVIRLQAGWFRGPIVAQMSQWVATAGQLGQLLSVVPFAWLLHQVGWTLSFGSLAVVGVVALVLVLVVVFDAPKGEPPLATGSIELPEGWWPRLRSTLRRPGTQLGLWTHFSLLATPNMFMLFWGYPMLVDGLGYDRAAAAGLLSITVLTGIVVGPIVGIATARFPLRRSNLVLGIVGLLVVTWSVVLAWPAEPPLWLLVALVVVLGIAGPGSTVGFDFARTFNPLRTLGAANGVVNVGGFFASFAMLPVVGLLLDLVQHVRLDAGEDAGLYDWTGFRIALSVQLLVLALGAAMIVRARRRTRVQLREEEGIEVGPVWRAIAAWLRRRRG
ncbi:MFS transporter [Agrococcus sp. SL85]|uniref:MFS transporter n=1 Tax=Agrococcus sp. SL85 TaxID=2995141 RepID=UPI00226CE37D|nr:MFS transporter [Agrococcus sp. SL85]WAC65782.1 MFS transporter [Agrococcus sp. SL85]